MDYKSIKLSKTIYLSPCAVQKYASLLHLSLHVESLFTYYTSNSPSVDLNFYRFTCICIHWSRKKYSLCLSVCYFTHRFGFAPLPMSVPAVYVESWLECGICLYPFCVLFHIFFCSSFLPLLMSFWILLCTSCMVAVATKPSAAFALISMFTVSDNQPDKTWTAKINVSVYSSGNSTRWWKTAWSWFMFCLQEKILYFCITILLLFWWASPELKNVLYFTPTMCTREHTYISPDFLWVLQPFEISQNAFSSSLVTSTSAVFIHDAHPSKQR